MRLTHFTKSTARGSKLTYSMSRKKIFFDNLLGGGGGGSLSGNHEGPFQISRITKNIISFLGFLDLIFQDLQVTLKSSQLFRSTRFTKRISITELYFLKLRITIRTGHETLIKGHENTLGQGTPLANCVIS